MQAGETRTIFFVFKNQKELAFTFELTEENLEEYNKQVVYIERKLERFVESGTDSVFTFNSDSRELQAKISELVLFHLV